MATLDTIRLQVQAEIPSCLPTTIDAAIIDACRTFSLDTGVIKSDITVPTVIGTRTYAVAPAAGSETLRVTAVLNGVTELRPTENCITSRNTATRGKPTHFWFVDSLLYLYPIPDAVYSLVVEAVIQPVIAATTLDTKFTPYSEALGYLALHKLKATSGQPWTDPSGAAFNYQRYMVLSGGFQIAAAMVNSTLPLRVKSNFF